MTYGKFITEGVCKGDFNAIVAIAAIKFSPLTTEQKEKFWNSETDSLDNFEDDFERFVVAEF